MNVEKDVILEFFREESYKPLSLSELEEVFQIASAQELQKLVSLLAELEQDGDILRTRRNRYGVPERMNVLKGKLQGHAKGFAFLITDQEGEQDVFVPEKELNGAMNGDRVLVRINQKNNGPLLEGEVIRVLHRALQTVVGTFQDMDSYGFVVPDDKRISHDIFIAKEYVNGAAEGHKVVTRLLRYPEGRRGPEGEIIEILGHKNDPGVDILAVIRKYELPEHFPDPVLKEAERAPDQILDEDFEGRRDLREETIVTIDGADAKDLDDAVSIKKLANGHYLLGVHIADVSHYVREGTALDKEAQARGTSVYLVDRVIPMLPHRLSNGICSLNSQVDRLTISCFMEVNAAGQVVEHEIIPSVIRTNERMTYTDVYKIVERKDDDVLARYEEFIAFFDQMKELALILRNKRMHRGAIDFDFKEASIEVDENGKPVDIAMRDRTIAEKIIEEFMLAANETVAEHFHWLNVPFIYRIHENPKQEKLLNFVEFVTNFGYVVRGSTTSLHPRALQQLLDQIKDTPEEMIISKVLLRSMQQARYLHENTGHFGLAAQFYTHFTSPIRRYPDLIVHRLLRTYLFEENMTAQTKKHWRDELPELAEHASQRERIAVDAERETDDLKKAEFMQDKIGEEYDGVISGVTSFGLFVELPSTIEGLVHVSNLTDDYYHFHEKQYAMIGERTGRIFRLGDPVTVRVFEVDVAERSIDFELVEGGHQSSPKRKRSKVKKETTASQGKNKQDHRKPKNKNKNKKATKTKGGQVKHDRPNKKKKGRG